MNDPAILTLSLSLTHLLVRTSFTTRTTYVFLSLLLFLFFPLANGSSRSSLLLSSALGGRRVAILALWAFCQTDYGTSGVSLAPLRPIIRPALSLVPLSLCLRVSVLIRHFVDTRIYTCAHAYIYVYARSVRQDVRDTLI